MIANSGMISAHNLHMAGFPEDDNGKTEDNIAHPRKNPINFSVVIAIFFKADTLRQYGFNALICAAANDITSQLGRQAGIHSIVKANNRKGKRDVYFQPQASCKLCAVQDNKIFPRMNRKLVCPFF